MLTKTPLAESPAAAFLDAQKTFAAAYPGTAGQRTHDQIARALIREYEEESNAKVVGAEGKLWRYENGLYISRSVDQLIVDIGQRYSSEKLCRKAADYRGIAEHAIRIADDARFFPDAPVGICTKAHFYRITSEGEKKEALSAQLRQRYALPCEPDFTSKRPMLDAFLNRAFAGDEAAVQIDRAGEVVGGVLSGALPALQKAILILGTAFTGKSAFVEILTALVPDEFVCSTPPDRWGHEYYLASLAGKCLNAVGESESTRPIPGAPFKRVTGGDRLQGRHPNHRPTEFYNTAAHIFLANVLPHSEDRGDGFFRRWEILSFTNVIPSGAARQSFAKLLLAAEFPQLLAFAIDGALRLARQGRFTPSKRHNELLLKWRMSTSSVLEFLYDEDVCTLKPGVVLPQLELFKAYQAWCGEAGRRPIGRNTFYASIDDDAGAAGVVRVTGHAGNGGIRGVELVHSGGW